MGLLLNPELCRCGPHGVELAYLAPLVSGHGWDIAGMRKQFGVVRLIRRRVTDAERSGAASSAVQAARSRQPLPIACGARDLSSPTVHGEKLHEALKAHDPVVGWVVCSDAGLGGLTPASAVVCRGWMERILAHEVAARQVMP